VGKTHRQWRMGLSFCESPFVFPFPFPTIPFSSFLFPTLSKHSLKKRKITKLSTILDNFYLRKKLPLNFMDSDYFLGSIFLLFPRFLSHYIPTFFHFKGASKEKESLGNNYEV
jgi:hypothetical protein